DFTPVGVVVAMAGLAYSILLGRHLLPVREAPKADVAELVQIDDYIAEAAVRPGGVMDAAAVNDLEAISLGEVALVALVRKGETMLAPAGVESLFAGDVLVLEGPRQSIQRLADAGDLDIAGPSGFTMDSLASEDVALIEAVVAPNSPMVNRTPRRLRLHQRYGMNLLAVARRGRPLGESIGATRFEVGDVLLLQGDRIGAPETLAALGLLPLAKQPENQERYGHLGGSLLAFGAAIAVTAAGLLPAHIAFIGAVLGLLLAGSVSIRDVYENVDWPIIILLAAMIPVGQALQSTGATDLLAAPLIGLAAVAPVALVIAALMLLAMLLSDVVNNAATAVVMAPIAIAVADGLGLSIDPFLMAIAIGASCTFLTPIGHQSNLLVMGPGGYRFSDYWRMGLALDLIIIAVATPMILMVWPPTAIG
ncbi:MAG: SLC13 family permease, partial [Pseudomonadota bacterium]